MPQNTNTNPTDPKDPAKSTTSTTSNNGTTSDVSSSLDELNNLPTSENKNIDDNDFNLNSLADGLKQDSQDLELNLENLSLEDAKSSDENTNELMKDDLASSILEPVSTTTTSVENNTNTDNGLEGLNKINTDITTENIDLTADSDSNVSLDPMTNTQNQSGSLDSLQNTPTSSENTESNLENSQLDSKDIDAKDEFGNPINASISGTVITDDMIKSNPENGVQDISTDYAQNPDSYSPIPSENTNDNAFSDLSSEFANLNLDPNNSSNQEKSENPTSPSEPSELEKEVLSQENKISDTENLTSSQNVQTPTDGLEGLTNISTTPNLEQPSTSSNNGVSTNEISLSSVPVPSLDSIVSNETIPTTSLDNSVPNSLNTNISTSNSQPLPSNANSFDLSSLNADLAKVDDILNTNSTNLNAAPTTPSISESQTTTPSGGINLDSLIGPSATTGVASSLSSLETKVETAPVAIEPVAAAPIQPTSPSTTKPKKSKIGTILIIILGIGALIVSALMIYFLVFKNKTGSVTKQTTIISNTGNISSIETSTSDVSSISSDDSQSNSDQSNSDISDTSSDTNSSTDTNTSSDINSSNIISSDSATIEADTGAIISISSQSQITSSLQNTATNPISCDLTADKDISSKLVTLNKCLLAYYRDQGSTISNDKLTTLKTAITKVKQLKSDNDNGNLVNESDINELIDGLNASLSK